MENLGATCFVNAAVQAVRPALEQLLPPADTLERGAVSEELRRLLDAAASSAAAAADPRGFVNVAERALGRGLNAVSDSSEFLLDVLARAAAECGRVADAFGVLRTAVVRCARCGEVAADFCDAALGVVVPAPSAPRELTPAEAVDSARRDADPRPFLCVRCGAEGVCARPETMLLLGEAVVLVLADPRTTTLLPVDRTELPGGGRYALVGLIGFRNGHYTALARRGYAPWRLLDDAREEAHALEQYLSWALATAAVFLREHRVDVCWHPRPASTATPSAVHVAGDFSCWHPLPCTPLGAAMGGAWRATLWLVRGAHQAKFIVDGMWAVDETLPTVLDPAGNVNNLLIVD